MAPLPLSQHTLTLCVVRCPACTHVDPPPTHTRQLVELQEDAWKLKVYMELQRMGQQLERLASGPGDSKDAEADCAGKERDTAAADEHGVSTGSGVPSCKQHEAGLQELDDEIADLDRQLVAARAELQGLMQAAQSVEGELEALSVADD